MKAEYTTELPIKISDCDAFGRWRPANMLTASQELAEVHAASFGLARADLLSADICWIIYRQAARMHAYPTYNETVVATTWPGAVEGPIFPRYYRFTRPDGSPVCDMVSGWILMGVSTRRPLRPSVLPRPIPQNDREPHIPLPSMLRIEGAEHIGSRAVCYSDLDVNGHMNNTRYIDWICDALGTEALRERGLTNWQINYIAEARPDEMLDLYAKKEDGRILTIGKRAADGKVVFEADVGY